MLNKHIEDITYTTQSGSKRTDAVPSQWDKVGECREILNSE